jgi:DNA-binding NtrC family response regulator
VSQDTSSPKWCVIIINDDTDLLSLFKDALENERIQTYVFTDHKHALEKIEKYPNLCSVILTDRSTQLEKEQRKFAKDVKAINPRIKVVLTSGYSLSQTSIVNESYDMFLQLPVKLSTLVSTVKEIMGE